MRGTIAVAKKELRSYFNSPIAYAFLVLFLIASTAAFFSDFFPRNQASLRSLFAAFPLLLTFLVPALTMRLFAEERKLGTLEVLLTLPLRPVEVVLGKFLASVALLALALLLTAGAPLTAALLGDLDWGPVAGGYAAALLLGAAYLAIGLVISALTENQILAFLATLAVCFLFWLVGEEAVTRLFSVSQAAVLQMFGTGARFRSVERGVIDLRDIYYYVGIVTCGLAFNVLAIETRKGLRRGGFLAGADDALKFVLVGFNVLAFGALLETTRVRLDLTAEREYTIGDVTRRSLAELPDRLEILGFFSEETHPKLAPLVPKIRDLVEEYRVASGGKVVARFVDPRGDEAAEKDAARRFDIRPTPFRLESKYESGVKSAYFALVVAFGDRHQRLSVEDLIEVDRGSGDDIVVRLRNLEYQLTRAIDKAVREFGSLDARLAEQKEPVRLLVYVSEPERLPEGEVRDFVAKKRTVLREVIEELAKRYKVGLVLEMIDPAAAPPGTADEIRKVYGVTPLRASAGSTTTFYLDAVVRSGGRAERVSVRDLPDRERSANEVREAIEASIRRLLPGALRRVGVAGKKIDLPPELMMQYYQQGRQPPGDEFQAIRQQLRQSYEVVDVDLSTGVPPLDSDVLLVLRPRDWTTKHEVAFDQYLMYGGKAIVCIDMAELGQQARSLALTPIAPKADELLATYGVTVRRELVLDDRNVPYPLAVERDLGGFRVRTIEQVPYPWFVALRGDSIDRENPVVGAVSEMDLYWASPLTVDAAKTKGLKVSTFLRSSEKAWTSGDLRTVEPKVGKGPDRKGYSVPEKVGRETLAVGLEGSLKSAFRDRPQAVTGGAGVEAALESPPSTRLVVIGDADFVSDIGPQISPAHFPKNVQFIENLIDWALLDEAMIRIRSRGTAERPLAETERSSKISIEVLNYAVPVALIVVFGVVRALLRRSAAKRVRKPATGGGAS